MQSVLSKVRKENNFKNQTVATLVNIAYKVVESLGLTLETNVTLHVSYTQRKKIKFESSFLPTSPVILSTIPKYTVLAVIKLNIKLSCADTCVGVGEDDPFFLGSHHLVRKVDLDKEV